MISSSLDGCCRNPLGVGAPSLMHTSCILKLDVDPSAPSGGPVKVQQQFLAELCLLQLPQEEQSLLDFFDQAVLHLVVPLPPEVAAL